MNFNVLKELVDSTEEAILIIEENGEITFSNAKAREHFGHRELEGKRILNLLSGRSRENFEKELFLLTEKSLPEVFFNTSFDNQEEEQSFRVRIKPFGSKSDLLVTITALEKYEPFNAYQLYKLLAENAYDINLMYHDDELLYVSPSVYDFLGYFDSEIKTFDDWLKLFHRDDLSGFLKEVNKDIKDCIPYTFATYRQKHKKGYYLWFETKIRREFRKDGSIVNILTSIDITQKKKIEADLEKQKEFIEELFDTDPNLIFVRDGNGKMLYCNQAVADLVGMSRQQFLELESNTFPAPKQNVKKYIEMEKQVINNGKELLIEEEIVDKDGIVNHFQTLKKPLKTKDGDVNLLNISTNINKIKFYQQENQKAMHARTEFFSAISHEIRTPMNAIMGMTDLLLKRKPREDQVKLLQALNFSSKNLLNLINDVLDFSKIEAGKVEIEEINFSLKELVENVYQSLKPKALSKNLSMGLMIDEKVPTIVKGDSVKLGQILNNLVGNAIKFTDRGNVSIYVSLVNKDEEGINIAFRVEDTGIGIPENRIKDVFNPFQQASSSTTRKYGGTGLGLTIVKNLVDILSGSMDVKSDEGKGSVFSFSLPLQYSDSKKIESISSQSNLDDVKWKLDLKVLYVEDVLTNQYLIEEILKDWGISVDMVSSGKEALKKVEAKEYDIILMDLQMPEMDGYETCAGIRNLKDKYFKKVPILALTANSSISTKNKIKKVGMQDYVLKPVNVENLRNKLIQYSRYKDEVNLSQLIDTENNGGVVVSSISYDQTDQLFLTNMVRYQEFLKKTIEEFDVNFQEMILSIKNHDLENFRRVHHRMKSILATLNMNDLSSAIDDIKVKLLDNEEELDVHAEIGNLKYQFDFVKDSLTNKLSSLKWH